LRKKGRGKIEVEKSPGEDDDEEYARKLQEYKFCIVGNIKTIIGNLIEELNPNKNRIRRIKPIKLMMTMMMKIINTKKKIITVLS